MSKTQNPRLTALRKTKSGGRTVTLRVPAKVWTGAKRQAGHGLETRLTAIVTQTLRLVARDGATEGESCR